MARKQYINQMQDAHPQIGVIKSFLLGADGDVRRKHLPSKLQQELYEGQYSVMDTLLHRYNGSHWILLTESEIFKLTGTPVSRALPQIDVSLADESTPQSEVSSPFMQAFAKLQRWTKGKMHGIHQKTEGDSTPDSGNPLYPRNGNVNQSDVINRVLDLVPISGDQRNTQQMPLPSPPAVSILTIPSPIPRRIISSPVPQRVIPSPIPQRAESRDLSISPRGSTSSGCSCSSAEYKTICRFSWGSNWTNPQNRIMMESSESTLWSFENEQVGSGRKSVGRRNSTLSRSIETHRVSEN